MPGSTREQIFVQRRDRRKADDVVLSAAERLSSKGLTSEQLDDLNHQAAQVRQSPARRDHLVAVFSVALAHWNEHHTSPSYLSTIASQFASEDGKAVAISTFKRIANGETEAPQHDTIRTLLVVAFMLSNGGHPSVSSPLAASLIGSLPEINRVGVILALLPERVRIKGIADRALSLYDFFASGEPVKQEDFSDVLSSPLFEGLEKAESDADLGRFSLTAIRLSPRPDEYIVSQAALSLLSTGRESPPCIHLKTTTYESGVLRVNSHGFVLPRSQALYLIQYHLDGFGLNITTVSTSELRDRSGDFTRGLILTFDRTSFQGVLASRIALIRAPPDTRRLESSARFPDLNAWASSLKTGRKLNTEVLTRFLHEESSVKLEVPAELVSPRDRRLARDWEDLIRVAKRGKKPRLETCGHGCPVP